MDSKNIGKIHQIIGPVVDCVFESKTPQIYEALKVDDLTLEVEQLIGNNIVRTVAMGPTEGLKRGMAVIATGGPISVPVGDETLGRIFNVLGNVVDNGEPLSKSVKLSPIHRLAPEYTELATKINILETGIKVIDLIAPFAKGGKVAAFGGAGTGKTVSEGACTDSGSVLRCRNITDRAPVSGAGTKCLWH